ncbi:hypothetical protein O0I10_000734 [Lichtheimia ornata]|uniref:Uncharacterized protein n=1 Tax=Lichtheimia ornata TaxID=688661 RepID=A0AAD7Y498_9FUNG|nr:uncharacterized protein O0I10_000734 [Lichtheimia ornata]KAJ8663492.1 hypothetical protein O0I10_000734 [Lichtheimia ornata]
MPLISLTGELLCTSNKQQDSSLPGIMLIIGFLCGFGYQVPFLHLKVVTNVHPCMYSSASSKYAIFDRAKITRLLTPYDYQASFLRFKSQYQRTAYLAGGSLATLSFVWVSPRFCVYDNHGKLYGSKPA